MKSKPKPEVVELDAKQLEAKLDEIEQVMGVEMARPFRLLLGWYLSLLELIQRKNTSIARLRRLLFGARTERTRDVMRSTNCSGDSNTGSEKDPDETDGPPKDTAPPAGGG